MSESTSDSKTEDEDKDEVDTGNPDPETEDKVSEGALAEVEDAGTGDVCSVMVEEVVVSVVVDTLGFFFRKGASLSVFLSNRPSVQRD